MRCTAAGKQTLGRCKCPMLTRFSGAVKRILCLHPKKIPAEIAGSPGSRSRSHVALKEVDILS